MATILLFKTEDRLPGSDVRVLAEIGDRQGAEIVIFPGVRYERAAEVAATAVPPRRETPRDRLEIIE
ncbi:MAG TPA: hypothetical protein VNK52_07150 [Hyphomicrobiaceae bacterium]|nr:hypothetical protein [Hyphomicrobiaceae bacterium]